MSGLIVYQTGSIADSKFITEQRYKLEDLALENIGKIEPGKFTGPEILAIKTFEMLSLTREYDLATIILRGQLIKEIKDKNLWSVHPENFPSASEAIAAKCGISRTQQSNIEALCNHIFPYIEQELGVSLPEFWADISPTNITEIVPHLMQIITGKESKSQKVREQLEKVYGEVEGAEDENRAAIEQLVEVARGTKEDLRKALRDVRTPELEIAIIRKDDRTVILAEPDSDQLKMLFRIAGDHIETSFVDLEQEDPSDIPIIRRFLRLLAEV